MTLQYYNEYSEPSRQSATTSLQHTFSGEVGGTARMLMMVLLLPRVVLGGYGGDPDEVGAELGSCCHSAWAILIGILQNRQEMLLSAKDRMREGSYGEEVGRQGHPPNFVRPSIEGEHKFGGWICPRWA